MPYANAMVKFVMRGQISGGEIWACGIWVSALGLTPSQTDLQVATDAAVVPVKAYFANSAVKAAMSTGVSFTGFDGYYYGANATVASLVAHAAVTPLAGSGTLSMPPQCCIVVSLRTQDPGRAGRGRFYLPHLGVGDGTGQAALSTAAGIATATGTMLTAINGISGLGVVAGGTSGFPVNRVQVDTIIDTQRRRTNQLTANSVQTASVTYP